MSLRAIVYAYVLGGLTFIPLLLLAACFYTIYTSVPVGDTDVDKIARGKLERQSQQEEANKDEDPAATLTPSQSSDVNDLPRPRKGWLTVRRTFEETTTDASYVGLVRGFLDARSKDPKRSRPKDMWYVVLKGKVLYLYEDESMTECEAAIELGSHDVVIYPEGLLDGELFAKRNAICLKPKAIPSEKDGAALPSVTKEMLSVDDFADKVIQKGGSAKQQKKDRERAQELEREHEEARQEALDPTTPWFIFVRSNVEMEDWYLSLVHASDNPSNMPTLAPLFPVFQPSDLQHLVDTLDEQPDVIPMRWLNALIGRLFFSYYRTQNLESYIIGRLMKKLSKIKRPAFLTDVSVREVSVGNRAPTLSKPMLKELTKEGDASLEVHLLYKGEVRITVDATATINLGSRFKPYTVKLVLAAVLREIEGNLLVKVKRPPSNRLWYAFTQMPRMVLDVEPVVSDRQITWSMILGTIESRLKEVIQESVVMPNMDDIAFFESSQYSHRGGIWADASRHERSADLFPSNATPDDTDETRTTASAPVSGSPTLVADAEPVEMERSYSAPIEPRTDAEPISSPEVVPVSRAQTVSGSSTSSSGSVKRRTWFGGAKDTENEVVANLSAGGQSVESERGRHTRPSEPSLHRSNSTKSASTEYTDEDTPRVVAEDVPTLARASSNTRSSSSHSRSSSPPREPSRNEPSSSSVQSDSLLAGFRSKSPGQSSRTPVTSPTSNFFQTLKSRDKQAISNTAKEAMRKWGVNWGGLKKDAPANSEEPVDGEAQKQSDSKTHKPRPSYAEVRAAVAQRKGGNAETLLVPSEPVTIPHTPEGKRRTTSISSLQGQGGTSGRSVGDSSSPSTSPRPDTLTAEAQTQPRSISPSSSPQPPRKRTTSHHSQFSGEGTASLSDEDEHPAQPIQTQPPAPKAMTIPGIHASHRGEVMSMGYAPPPAPSTGQKLAPTIQTVYRLWKSPTGTGEQDALSESGPHTQSGFTGRDQDDIPSSSTAPSRGDASSSPALPQLARPVPPPLPPRSQSTHAVQLLSEPPKHPPELDRSSPPASATLQSIVSRDDSKRASLEPVSSPSSSPGRPVRSENDERGAQEQPSVTVGNSSADDQMTPDNASKPKPPALPPRRTPAQIVA